MTAVMQEKSALNDFEKSIELVHVVVSDLDIYIPLINTERIIPIINLLPVPSGPDYLKGLMSLAGKTIPVIDLGERMGIYNPTPYTMETLILICSDEDKSIGLIIDDIIGLDIADEQQVQLQPMFSKSNTPVIAVINSEQGMSLLLDLEKIMDINLTINDKDLFEQSVLLFDQVLD